MKYKYIFWDWNGTLMDDAEPTWLAVNAMLKARNLPLITFEQYRDYVEMPIIRFYEKVMDMSCESMEKISVEFNTYWAQFLRENPLFSNTQSILSRMAEKGIKQYIFSSSQNKYIEPILKQFGIDVYFQHVIGARDCYVRGKAELTKQYMEEHGINPKEAILVGDMVHDSEVASYVGADCILLSTGHQSRKALEATGNNVASDLEEIFLYV